MRWLIVLVVAVSLPSRRGDAQMAAGWTAPIACFVSVVATGLDDANAQHLCIGATSTAPVGCYRAGVGAGTMTQYQAVVLCAGAESSAPIDCALHLEARSGIVTASIVSYCAALQWPLVPPSAPGAPECISAATATGIVDQQAIDVCRGSQSSEPAECIKHGHDVTGLSDTDLVALCTRVVPYPVGSYYQSSGFSAPNNSPVYNTNVYNNPNMNVYNPSMGRGGTY